MFSKSGAVHCQYCMAPVEIWKHSMTTYAGDECKLYSDFSDVVWELENTGKPFNDQDILEACRKGFEHEYTDIKDFEACINEMIGIHVECGVFSRDYRPLSIEKK